MSHDDFEGSTQLQECIYLHLDDAWDLVVVWEWASSPWVQVLVVVVQMYCSKLQLV